MEHRTAAVEHVTRAPAAECVTAAAMEGGSTSASEHSTTTMEGRAGVKAATTMEATAAVEATATTAEMSAAMAARTTDLNCHGVRRGLCRRPSARPNRRHRRRGPTGRTCEYEKCCRRKTEATSKTSTLVLHPHHGPFSLNAVK